MSDTVIWNAIGAKHFCSYKKKITENTFCRNKYNISGLCSRQACPLANSRYATVLEHQGKLYLYMKTPERAHTPKDMWERIPLHPNFFRALAQISKHLQFWPRFIRKKAKQRLTKLHQYLIRLRRLRTKVQPELVAVKRKEKKQEQRREAKAHRAAHLQDSIRTELLQRLRQGTYGELYDDIVNFAQQEFEDVLDNEAEDEEFDWLGESQFVEAYSDDEEDEDQDEDYEYEYEVETTKNRQRERVQSSGADDDDDDDSGDGMYGGSGFDSSQLISIEDGFSDEEQLDAFEDDDDDDDDSDDIEDSAPDFEQISAKTTAFASAPSSKAKPRYSTASLPALVDKPIAVTKTTALKSGRLSSVTKPTTQKTSSFAERARARQSGAKSRRSIDDDE